VVDVAEGEMASAGDVVELVAKVAVADVGGVDGEGELEEQFDDSERSG
jgi:hypothetical protein